MRRLNAHARAHNPYQLGALWLATSILSFSVVHSFQQRHKPSAALPVVQASARVMVTGNGSGSGVRVPDWSLLDDPRYHFTACRHC